MKVHAKVGIFVAVGAVVAFVVYDLGLREPVTTTLSGPVGLISNERLESGVLGIEFAKSAENASPTVSAVLSGSGAASSGILVGDRIVAIDGTRVSEEQAARHLLSGRKPGQVVHIEIDRQGKKVTVDPALLDFREALRLKDQANGQR